MQALVLIWLIAAFILLLFNFHQNLLHDWDRAEEPVLNPDFFPELSLIICAKNEAENLKEYLPRWCKLAYTKDWEIIVVDDGSDDDTPAVLEDLAQRFGHLKHYRLDPKEKKMKGKKAALALGISKAQYEHLLFSDADCAPAHADFLQHQASAYVHSDIVLGYGALRRSTNGSFISNFCQWLSLDSFLRMAGLTRLGLPYMGVGRNMGYTKEIYKKAGGFADIAEFVSGDDDLFVQKAFNYAHPHIVFHPKGTTRADTPDRFSDWWKQRQRHLGVSHAYHWKAAAVLGFIGLAEMLYYLLLPVAIYAGFGLFCLLSLLLRYVLLFRIFRYYASSNLLWKLPIYECFSVFTSLYLHMLHLLKPGLKRKMAWS